MKEDNPLDARQDKLMTTAIARQMGEIEGIDEYLRTTMGLDMQRYFVATEDPARGYIKGHFGLAKYLHDTIIKERKKLAKK